jgi:signal peptidase I
VERYSVDADKSSKIEHSVLKAMWQEARDKSESFSFRVVSGSMRPWIEVGDLVKIIKVEPTRIGIGDIVAVQEEQEVVVHRIIRKYLLGQQLVFCHRGDTGVGSSTVAAQNVIGKACVIEKGKQQVYLDTTGQVIRSKILGWQSRFEDTLLRARYRRVSMGLRFLLRPWWRVCRGLLLLRFK